MKVFFFQAIVYKEHPMLNHRSFHTLLFFICSLTLVSITHTTDTTKQTRSLLRSLRSTRSNFDCKQLFNLKAAFYQSLLDGDYPQAQAIIIVIAQDTSKLYDAAIMQEELDSVWQIDDEELKKSQE